VDRCAGPQPERLLFQGAEVHQPTVCSLLTQRTRAVLHDLHVWGPSTTETALTVHLVMPAGLLDEDLQRLRHELHEQFV